VERAWQGDYALWCTLQVLGEYLRASNRQSVLTRPFGGKLVGNEQAEAGLSSERRHYTKLAKLVER
jgi:hypothetical protein